MFTSIFVFSFFLLKKNLSLKIFLIWILFSGLARVWQVVEIPSRILVYPQQDSGQSLQIQLFFANTFFLNKSCKYDYLLWIYIYSLLHVVFKILYYRNTECILIFHCFNKILCVYIFCILFFLYRLSKLEKPVIAHHFLDQTLDYYSNSAWRIFLKQRKKT